MCLSIPSQVVALHPELDQVTVDTLGVTRQVSTLLLGEPLAIGDYVLLHVGFAMSRVDAHEAAESLAYYRQMLAADDEAGSGAAPC